MPSENIALILLWVQIFWTVALHASLVICIGTWSHTIGSDVESGFFVLQRDTFKLGLYSSAYN